MLTPRDRSKGSLSGALGRGGGPGESWVWFGLPLRSVGFGSASAGTAVAVGVLWPRVLASVAGMTQVPRPVGVDGLIAAWADCASGLDEWFVLLAGALVAGVVAALCGSSFGWHGLPDRCALVCGATQVHLGDMPVMDALAFPL